MSEQHDPKTGKFLPGHSPTPGGGRPVGTRNRLTTHLLNVLCKDFEEHGEAVVKITRIERPVEYLKIIASLLPKELQVNDAKLGDMTDEEIAGLLATVREMRAQATASPALRQDRDNEPEPSVH
jgi:hypothetical protein